VSSRCYICKVPIKLTGVSSGGSETEEPASHEAVVNDASIGANALAALASIHVIDQALTKIARDTRFTIEEVKEYYDKCGEMERTRARFEAMRACLKEKFHED